jgi:hypothetical protein
LPWLLVGVFATLWLTKSSQGSPQSKVTDSLPTLVESVRDLGFLESKELNLQESFSFATHKQPADWAAAIPGASSLVESATKNEIWITASGQVKAGFDLSQAQIKVSGDTVTIKLPAVSIQRPDVDIKLQGSKPGRFWKDEAIALKALSTARERFSGVASKLKIERAAFESAQRRLCDLVGKMTPRRVIVERT